MLTQNYVTITHVPTGVTATVDSNYSKSLYKCKEMAMKLLKSKLVALQLQSVVQPCDVTYDVPDDALHLDDVKEFRDKPQLGEV